MEALLDAIYSKTSGSTLASDVGGRIYPDYAPPGCELPYVVFFIVSGVPEYPGGHTMENIMVQFSIFSDSPGTAEGTTILADLRTLFDDCSLTITGETLVFFIRGNAQSLVDEIATPDGVTMVRHYVQEYEISTVK